MAYGGSQARGRIGAELPAYTAATATWDPSHICNLYHSSWQCQILNPLSKARDHTHNLKVPSQIHFCCAMTGTPQTNDLDLHKQVQQWLQSMLNAGFNRYLEKPFFRPWGSIRSQELLLGSNHKLITTGFLAVLTVSCALPWILLPNPHKKLQFPENAIRFVIKTTVESFKHWVREGNKYFYQGTMRRLLPRLVYKSLLNLGEWVWIFGIVQRQCFQANRQQNVLQKHWLYMDSPFLLARLIPQRADNVSQT